MTTKHTPVTPLPPLGFSVTAAEIVSAGWRGQPPTERLTNDEKREVVRRANAFPQLEAALRDLTELMESGMLINHPQCAPERRDDHANKYERALTVLTKLGKTS